MLLPPPRSTLFPYTTLFRSTASAMRASRSTIACRSAPLSRHQRHGSEEHTSELQSRFDLVCRLLLEKKKLLQRIHVTKKHKRLKHQNTQILLCIFVADIRRL